MKKNSRGLFGVLARAIVWAAKGIFGAIIWIVKGAFGIISFLLKHAATAAHKGAQHAVRPRAEAADRPLVLQKQIAGNLNAFEERICSLRSTIGIVLGARGSGKSAIGMRLLENVFARIGRPVCAIGFDAASLPGWIRCVNTVDEVPNGSFVLVDEGGILFSSRASMSSANKVLSSLLLVARHKDLSVLFISQNSANLELNAIRQADYLLLRKPSLLQQEFERKKIGEIYAATLSQFPTLPNQGRYSTYIYSDEFRGFVSNELPSFWSMKTGKSFAGFHPPAK